MKTIFKYFLITIIFSCSNIFTSTAQFVVKIRPANPKVFVSKPAINKHGYLWRNGHWKWAENQKKYIWVKAHWTKQNKNRSWIDGYWITDNKGHNWIPGHWSKKKIKRRHRKHKRIN